MNTRTRILALILIMAVVAAAAAGVSTWMLYRAAIAEERARLTETAQSQARLIETVAKFDRIYSNDYSEGATAATISQIDDAHDSYEGFGETGEFALARREGDEIVFIMRHPHQDIETLEPVPWRSTLAEPMRRALDGHSGTVIGPDYRGVTVLAAYEPVAVLGLGIVAKIDLAEIRTPFIHAALVSGLGALVIVALGALVFRHIGVPLVEREQRAEKALKESESQLMKAQRLAKIGSWSWSIETDELISCSPEYARIHGVSMNEIKGVMREQMSRVVHPEDRERVVAAFRKFDDQGRNYEIEYRIVRPDGEVRHVIELGEAVFDDSGRPIAHTGTLQDITERKFFEEALRESEARYREIFDEAPLVIWEEDWSAIRRMIDELAEEGVDDWPGYFRDSPDEVRRAYDLTRTINISRMALDMYRVPDRTSLIRSNRADTATREEFDAFRDTLLAFLAGNPRYDFEVTDKRHDGSSFLAHFWAVIPPKHRRDWSRVIYAIQDVSAQREAEAALRVMKEEAELANRAKSEFLANMSHELRTPLNAIIGFSEMIRDGIFGPLGSPKYLEYARDINVSGQHLLDLINDILDLAKIEAGKLELNEDDVDVAQIVGTCLTLIKERADSGGIVLSACVPPKLPGLRADERKLKQIVINLLSNAVKFTPAEGTVELSVGLGDDGGYRIAVADTGIGIAPEDVPKALEPFGQVEGGLDRKCEGTGLGLPLTKALVELHGGVLEVASEVGAGTIITANFPAARTVALTSRTAC